MAATPSVPFSRSFAKKIARGAAQRNALGRRLERRVSSARVAARRALAVTRARTRRTRTQWPWPCPRSGASSAPPSRPRRFPDPPAARARRFHAPSPRIERAVSRRVRRPPVVSLLRLASGFGLRATAARSAVRATPTRAFTVRAAVASAEPTVVKREGASDARSTLAPSRPPRSYPNESETKPARRDRWPSRDRRPHMPVLLPRPSHAAIPTSPSLAPTPQTSSRATRTTT